MQPTFTNQLISENYKIEKVIREYQNGNLFLAKNKKTEESVFLHVFFSNYYSHTESPETGKQRFEDLMNVLQDHKLPHTSNILDYEYVLGKNTESYQASSFHEHPTLASYLKKDALEAEDGISLLSSLALTLSKLHNNNCVLGNLSPDTIHVFQDNDQKYQGIISHLGTDNIKYVLNEYVQDRDIQFIHPELFDSSITLKPYHDVYSIGVLMYHVLTNTYPYIGTDPEKPNEYSTDEYIKNCKTKSPVPLTKYIGIPSHIDSFCTDLISESIKGNINIPLDVVSSSLKDFIEDLCSTTAYDFDLTSEFLENTTSPIASTDDSDNSIYIEDLETSGSIEIPQLENQSTTTDQDFVFIEDLETSGTKEISDFQIPPLEKDQSSDSDLYYEDDILEKDQAEPTVTMQQNNINLIGSCIGEIYLSTASQGYAYTVSGSNHLVMASNDAIEIYDLNDGAKKVKKIDSFFGKNKIQHIALIESQKNNNTPVYCFVSMHTEDNESTLVHTYDLRKGIRVIQKNYCYDNLLLSQTDTINPFFIRDEFLHMVFEEYLLLYDIKKHTKNSPDNKFYFPRTPLLVSPRKNYMMFALPQKKDKTGLTAAIYSPIRTSEDELTQAKVDKRGKISELFDYMTYAPKNNLLYLQEGSTVHSFILSPNRGEPNLNPKTTCIQRSTSALSEGTKRIKTTYVGNNLFGIEDDKIAFYQVSMQKFNCKQIGNVYYNMNDLFVNINSYPNSKFTIIEEKERLFVYMLFDK